MGMQTRVRCLFTVLLGLLVAMAVVPALATPALAAFPGNNGKIVFDNSEWGFYTVNPDGSDFEALANGKGPAYSADGTKIVYVGDTGIRQMNFDGTSNRPVLNQPASDPNWSPNGSKIVFSGISIVNADGSGLHFVTAGAEPEWSPDGSRLVFTRTASGRTDVFTSNPDGTGVANLTGDVTDYPGYNARSPTWSPDGSKILYESSRCYVSGGCLYVMNPDGSGKTLVGGYYAYSPAWSPDGTKIAYRWIDGIHVMAADGSGDTLITPASSSYRGMDWQPCPGPCPAPAPVPYDVPRKAERAYIKFVPNFRQTISDTQCAARGGSASTHGAPLSVPSCNPPAYLPGTVAHQGPNGDSGVFYARGSATSDGVYNQFYIQGGGTDIQNAAGGDYNPTPGDDATLTVKMRITDTYNGHDLNLPATVADFELGLPASCVPDPEQDIGSTCAAGTSTEAFMPGAISPDRRTVIQLFEVQMKDVGADGVRGNADDRSFLFQGVYVP